MRPLKSCEDPNFDEVAFVNSLMFSGAESFSQQLPAFLTFRDLLESSESRGSATLCSTCCLLDCSRALDKIHPEADPQPSHPYSEQLPTFTPPTGMPVVPNVPMLRFPCCP